MNGWTERFTVRKVSGVSLRADRERNAVRFWIGVTKVNTPERSTFTVEILVSAPCVARVEVSAYDIDEARELALQQFHREMPAPRALMGLSSRPVVVSVNGRSEHGRMGRRLAWGVRK